MSLFVAEMNQRREEAHSQFPKAAAEAEKLGYRLSKPGIGYHLASPDEKSCLLIYPGTRFFIECVDCEIPWPHFQLPDDVKSRFDLVDVVNAAIAAFERKAVRNVLMQPKRSEM